MFRSISSVPIALSFSASLRHPTPHRFGGGDIDAHLDHLASGDAEFVPLEIGAL
jgi:hypothetical protein